MQVEFGSKESVVEETSVEEGFRFDLFASRDYLCRFKHPSPVIRSALELAEAIEKGVIVVCGSFYVVSKARALLCELHPEAFCESDVAFSAVELGLKLKCAAGFYGFLGRLGLSLEP